MARLARVVAVGIPHHVTQRGNARQFILSSDADRLVYLELLREYSALHQLSVIGYCLMSNHVHLVVIPQQRDALAKALKQTHGRYSAYWNVRYKSSGHVWQGRYYSCPLDTPHLWEALRYAELNPVGAGMVAEPESWAWSSAAAHVAKASPDICLEMDLWQNHWSFANWRQYLAAGATDEEVAAIRESTHTGRPLGTAEFVSALEASLHRRLAPQKGGRLQKPGEDERQTMLGFEN
jgi:putative transposase